MQTQGANPPLLLKLKMEEVVSKSLLDCVDFTHYMDPDLFNLGSLTHYFLRDDEEEELFAEVAYSGCGSRDG